VKKKDDKEKEEDIVRVGSNTPGVPSVGKVPADHPLEFSEKEVK